MHTRQHARIHRFETVDHAPQLDVREPDLRVTQLAHIERSPLIDRAFQHVPIVYEHTFDYKRKHQ